MGTTIDGIILTPLRIIEHPKGNVMHGLKVNEPSFAGFGEVYFSQVNFNEVKGWKKHKKMIANLLVPFGEVKFVIYDDRKASTTNGKFCEYILSPLNYYRLTIKPGLWYSFMGLDKATNLVLNIASIEHDPAESESREIEAIPYNWTNNHIE